MAFSILSVTEVEAKSKKKYRLSYTSKAMEQGELYNISLKGVPKSVGAPRLLIPAMVSLSMTKAEG